MDTQTLSRRQRTLHVGLFISILLIAAALRFIALDKVPPGLTHDEADHALDAMGVVNGIRPIYFTVGYGREPLYDYATSVMMLVVGQNYIASRLTAALFGMALLVLVYAHIRKASGNIWLALATMAALAVGFWSVMHGRAALRSITMPTLFTAATFALWYVFDLEKQLTLSVKLRPTSWVWFAIAGLLLGASIYTYLAARVMWLVFPAFFVVMAVFYRRQMVKLLPGLGLLLAVAAATAAPLLLYLRNNPTAEVRVGQLASPIDALFAGNPGPLLENTLAGLQIIFLYGDDLWLYNIPGRPLLMPLLGGLFAAGLIIATGQVLRPHHGVRQGKQTEVQAFRQVSLNTWMLLTLAAGLVPALIVGIGGSSTRVIGMMPALYYFPALAVWHMAQWAERKVEQEGAAAIWGAYTIIICIALGTTIHQYFNVWANHRDVRVAYHTTLIETLAQIEQSNDLGKDMALSTITPGPFHDAAVATVFLRRDDLTLRWFDGRSSLVIPASSEGTWVFPEVAELNQKLTWWIVQEDGYRLQALELRPDDFNRTVDFVTWDELPRIHTAQMGHIKRVDFDGTMTLINTTLLPRGTISPGDTLTVITWWRIDEVPAQDLVLFTHALDDAGMLVAQQDLLGVPTTSWYQGDIFLQMHELQLSPDLQTTSLNVVVGAYTQTDVIRLNAFIDGQMVGQQAPIGTLQVTAP